MLARVTVLDVCVNSYFVAFSHSSIHFNIRIQSIAHENLYTIQTHSHLASYSERTSAAGKRGRSKKKTHTTQPTFTKISKWITKRIHEQKKNIFRQFNRAARTVRSMYTQILVIFWIQYYIQIHAQKRSSRNAREHRYGLTHTN